MRWYGRVGPHGDAHREELHGGERKHVFLWHTETCARLSGCHRAQDDWATHHCHVERSARRSPAQSRPQLEATRLNRPPSTAEGSVPISPWSDLLHWVEQHETEGLRTNRFGRFSRVPGVGMRGTELRKLERALGLLGSLKTYSPVSGDLRYETFRWTAGIASSRSSSGARGL